MSLRQNALLMAALTAFIAIMGAWSGDAMLERLWQLPLALLLLGLAFERWMTARASLDLTFDASQRGVLGRKTTLRAMLTQRLARGALVELAPDVPQDVETEARIQSVLVPAGSAGAADLTIVPRRLGEHSWPPMRARIAGPLGLAWWTRKLAPDFRLHVVPALLEESEVRAGAVSLGSRSRSILGAGSELLQLREYRGGDPQHLIDWKATARSGRLVSRDFSEDQHLEIVIAVDAGRGSAVRAGELDRLGHYANLAARFAEHAVAQDDRIGLVVFADRPLAALSPARGTAAVMKVRKLLTATKIVSAESNPLSAALRIRSLVRQRSLIVMLTDLDDATAAGQLAAAARLLLPKHLPLVVGLASEAAEDMRFAPARSWLDPYEALAAQEYCARLNRNVHALRALGAPALLVRPERLERAVFGAYAEFRQRRRV
jgi:uncharacterized protein (DUF58 family)